MISFSSFQKEIETFVSKKQGHPSYTQKGFKLQTSDALFCVEDRKRNRYFWEAIKQAIQQHPKKNLTSVDAGAGTGVLGIYSLLWGAKHCYFLEQNPYTMQLCKDVVAHFGYTEKASFIQGDIVSITVPKFDLLISETITADFGTEDFHHIINHSLKSKNQDARIIPEGFTITLIQKDIHNTVLQKQSFFVSSYDGFTKKTIALATHTHVIETETTVHIFNEILHTPGTSLFCNKRKTYRTGDTHSLFA